MFKMKIMFKKQYDFFFDKEIIVKSKKILKIDSRDRSSIDNNVDPIEL